MEASLKRLPSTMLLEQVLHPENLRQAWRRAKQDKGGAGIGGITLDGYPKWAQPHWQNVKRGLGRGYYCPQPAKRVEIPKPNGGARQLGIPCANDRLVQQAITQCLQPTIGPGFPAHNYGFRPNRPAHQAIQAVQGFIKAKYRYAVDMGLSKFFDQVDHDLLMHRLAKRIGDKRVLALVGRYPRAGISDEGSIPPNLRGVPQGGPLPPLLANVMPDDLDRYLESKNYRFARYADDFVICVKTFAEGGRTKQEVESFLKTPKLPVNQEKSQVIPVNQPCFLGYQFKGRHLGFSAKSLQHFKQRIRGLTSKSWGVSWAYRYLKLKHYAVGWMNYFVLVTYDPIGRPGHWIRRRIRMCYLKQWRKPRTRIRNLVKLGVSTGAAISIGMGSKGYYRLAKTKAVQLGLNNAWLKAQGLVSPKGQWVKFRYPNG